VAREPVYFLYDGVHYLMKSTGTFAAHISGKALPPGPWADVSANEGDNVYFKMAVDEGGAIGIWTTHIAFLTGRQLLDSDVKGLYSR
jgi:hypothetical protein